MVDESYLDDEEHMEDILLSCQLVSSRLRPIISTDDEDDNEILHVYRTVKRLEQCKTAIDQIIQKVKGRA